MSVGEMWKSNALTLTLLIILNLALFTLGTTPWMVIGIIILAAGPFFSYRQGMGYGHQACGILATVQRAADPQSPAHNQIDEKIVRRAFSPSTGVKGVLLSALIPYIAGCLYIIVSLLNVEAMILPTRLISWVLATPFWPLVLAWNPMFDRLTPTAAAVLMVSPFVIPLATYIGYMQGPKLWAKSEKAMADGKRRAKAKSRVVRKKRTPKAQKPEI